MSEERLQRDVAEWLRVNYPNLLWWHTPNGGGRTISDGLAMKLAGVKRGVPDLVFVGTAGTDCYFIELKTANGTLSAEQIEFSKRVRWFAVCRSVQQVESRLKEWGFI